MERQDTDKTRKLLATKSKAQLIDILIYISTEDWREACAKEYDRRKPSFSEYDWLKLLMEGSPSPFPEV